MVVLRPMPVVAFDSPEDREAVSASVMGEIVKRCPCGHTGIASPVRERSSYQRNRSCATGWSTECRACQSLRKRREFERDPEGVRARRRARYAARVARETPEETAERRRRQREVKARTRERDPEGVRARQRPRDRAYRAANRKRVRENARIAYRLRRERQGDALKVAFERKGAWSSVRWPAGPYQEWMRRLLGTTSREFGLDSETEGYTLVAPALGLSSRRLWGHMHTEEIGQSTVERVCARHGAFHPGDIYPHAYGRGPTTWGSGTPKDPYHVLPEGWQP